MPLLDDIRNVHFSEKASAADLPVTAYVRDAAFGRELTAGSQVVAELRRLGGFAEASLHRK
jgi:hypothetical protein